MATANDPEEADDQNSAVANFTDQQMSSFSPELRELLNSLQRDNPTGQPTPSLMTPGASRPGTVDSDTLKLMLEEANQTFVPTRTFKDIRRSLEKNCHVSICGASGEGKTTMALMLGLKYIAQGYDLVFVNRLDTFDFGSCISSGQKICLIFDDIFGSVGHVTDFTCIQTLCKLLKFHIDKNLMSKQKDKFNTKENGQTLEMNAEERGQIGGMDKDNSDINKQSSTKHLRVIFTAKSYNFKEGMSKMQYQRLFCFNKMSVFDLTLNPERSYSHQEKKTMFQKHRDLHPNIKIEDDIVESIHKVHQESILFGFPLLCRLFFSCSTFTEKAVDFFKRPLFYLQMELNDILSRRNDQAAALILVLLCEEHIKLPELESPSINTKVDEMFVYVTTFSNSASRSGTAAAARSFRGTFLSKGDNLCFSHSSIYEACACALYQFNPTFVLKFCSLDFLHERLKPEHVGESAVVSDYRHHLFVSEEYFHLVVTRMITPMKQGTFSKTVVHPMYRNESFVEKFLEELGTSAKENMAWVQYKERGRGFLYWIIKSKSPKLVQSIEEVLLINFTQEDINEALMAAVECDSLTILKYLVGRLEQNPDETYMNKLLLVSAESSSKEMVTYLLKIGAKISGTDIKNRNILHLLCVHDRSTVLESIASQTEITYDDLHRAKTALDRDKRTPVMLAALHGTFDCFKQMQYADSGDLSDCNGDHLIHLACEGGNINIVQTVLTSLNINTRGQMGLTPITKAAYKAHSEILDLLLSENADRGLVDNNGNALIHYACLGGSKHNVERLLTPENINSRGHHEWTPIMCAANNALTEVFDFLLSKDANVALVDGKGNTLLHHGCLGGSKYIVERLVTSENINTRNKTGITPIMAAAIKAHAEVFDFLLSKNADVALVDGDGDSLLHLACLGGSKHIVERLVTSENINTRNKTGITPIMAAAIKAHAEVFDFLLSKNADVALVDGDGDSLLHLACLGGSKHIVERLVTSENINTRNKTGITPIMAAAIKAHAEVFDFLLSKNADVALVDGDGDSLLHLACLGGSKHIIERLVTSENINTRGQNGMTPILAAANNALTDVFDFLLSKNADRGLVDGNGNTLLHYACLGGSKHIVECLVTPENINTRNKNGMTPILAAANKAHAEVFDFLLSKNADVALVDGNGNTLLHYACLGGSKHIVECLVTPENINTRNKNGMTPILAAANKAHAEVFDFLLSKNADVALVDGNGNTLLHYACLGGSKHIVECLVTPENINTRNKNGMTPILAAANKAHAEVFDFLLSKNADVALVDGDGNTLLHYGCFGGSKYIVECLVTSENINTRDQHGLTPTMTAAITAHAEVFDFLLSKNADVALVDGDGDSLLHYACLGGNNHIVECLVTPENINTRGKNGLTPIMVAANKAHAEVFDFLLSKNADRGLVGGNGNTLLHYGCFGGSKHIVERLVTSENINNRGKNGSTPIMAAANKALTEVFDFLLSKDAEVGLVDGNGNTSLYYASLGGSKHIVECLVTPENINTRGQNGLTPIMAAANKAHTEVFDFLLSKNADVALVDGDGETLLHLACFGGSKHIVERLVTSENINTRGQNGLTPIMAAANKPHTEVFDFLLSKNADVALVDGDGDSLLHLACFGGSKHIVERLVTSENINTRGQNGLTPILAAAITAHAEVFDFLLSKNADVALVDGNGNTSLHYASLGGSKHIVERLVTSENINTRGQNGLTPIMAAANKAHTEVFDFLLSKNADRGLVGCNGNTLLHLACLGGSKHIVERLVTPENINTRGQNGLTPIMAAANNALTEVFDFLLSKNTDRGLVDGNGDILLHLACLGGSKHIVERLVTPENINTRVKNGLTPIMAAANKAHTEVFDFLLSKNADRGLVGCNGNTLLHLACLGGSKHIVERLVTPENINTRGQNGLTPIMAAANKAHTEVFDFLLSKNADEALVDGDGDSLLHLACLGGSKHIVERLVTSENINTRGQNGLTPIMAAVNKSHTEVFDFLLSKNADRGLVGGNGHPLLHLACLRGSKHIVERLVTPENINNRGKHGSTPIMAAANKAHTEVFDFLLSKNADRGLVGCNGNTLLFLACVGGSKHIVECLVTPENINTRSKIGFTPIMAAANRAHTEVFDFLLSKNADVALVGGIGNSLLHLACLGGSKHIVERLVTPENINTRSKNGFTPIMAAASKAHTEVFDFLLSKNADRGLVGGNGNTLLHFACLGGSKHIVERLVTPENINTRGQNGLTPIMAAANRAHTEVFDFLLSKNADRGLVDGNGNTLLHHSNIGGSKHIVESSGS